MIEYEVKKFIKEYWNWHCDELDNLVYNKVNIDGFVSHDVFNSALFQKFNSAIHKLLIGTDRKININFK